jgi:NADH dehydrogenase
MTSATDTHQVVIIGGGFGGLHAARSLGRRNHVQVTLVDKRNFHLFQPLLYQVATGGLSPGDIASSYREILGKYKNIRILMAEVIDIDIDTRTVRLHHGEMLHYHSLVVAAGSCHHYFGNHHWEKDAPGLKTIEDALEIRRRVLLAFEAAELERNEEARRNLLTFVVVGGGPTGVELAGTLGEITQYTLRKDFRHINPAEARILLVEGMDRILTAFPVTLSQKAVSLLNRLGVEVRTQSFVTDIQPGQVALKRGNTEEIISSHTVLWAAGVQAAPLGKTLLKNRTELLDKMGRVNVAADLSVPEYSNVYVIGDLSHYSHQTGQPLPGLAPVAIQEGKYVAQVIVNKLHSRRIKPFLYRDKGNLATIGRAAAVGMIGRLQLSGYPAWLIWLFVHLMYLVGFENRVLVFIQWAWNYFTWNRGARLITGRTLPLERDSESKQLEKKVNESIGIDSSDRR